jgi:hypothetical protein
MSEFKKRLEDFLEYVEELETKLREARHHIKKNIGLFSPEELECMAMDGLIEYKDIPFDKRTEYVARHIKTEEIKREGKCLSDSNL